MNQNEKNQSQGKNQPDAGPDVMQQESPRTCKICGGPNHYGCGCEAKQLREAKEAGLTENEAKALQEPEEQPASETDDTLEDILSPDAIRKSTEAQMKSYKDIERVADGFEGLCACMYDTNNYLKLIAGDLITIRKILSKEDEVKDAPENKD